MIRAILLIFDPTANWDKIVKGQRGFLFVLLVHLLPLMAITLGIEWYGLSRFGETRWNLTNEIRRPSPELINHYIAAQFTLNLLVILVAAKFVQRIGNNFHSRHTYRECFTTLAYSLSPLFLAHIIDGWRGINTWVCFAIGITLSIAVLYQGIPRIMRPDPTKALGLYLLIGVLVTAMTGVVQFVTIMVLHGDLNAKFWQYFRQAAGA